MTVPRSEIGRVLRVGLPAGVDPVMTPLGFARRANSSVFRRALPGLTQTLSFQVSRRVGSPLWQVGGRFDVDAPEVRQRALGLAGGLTPFRRSSLEERATFSFHIEQIWGIASGSWYVLPEGVPEFMSKVGDHLATRILPLVPGLSSIATVAAEGVPDGVPRNYYDPLMVAACRLIAGDPQGAQASLLHGYEAAAPGNEWVAQALAAVPS